VRGTPRRSGHQPLGRLRGRLVDDALAETINGLCKTEPIKPRDPWKSVDDVEIATVEWVDWFSHRCLNEYCGDIPPTELEAAS
jgi:putative transposase